MSERIAALNVPLMNLNGTTDVNEEEELEIDDFSKVNILLFN